jgi:hypothetical protein
MLGRISVNRLLSSAMYGEICLLVTSQVQFLDGHNASNGCFKNGRLDGHAFPDDLP